MSRKPSKQRKSSQTPSQPSCAISAESSSSLSTTQASGAIPAQTMSTNTFEALATSKLIPGITAPQPVRVERPSLPPPPFNFRLIRSVNLGPPSPRAPSPLPSVLSSKWPHLWGSSSSSSGPSLAASSVCSEEDSSMALDYASVTLRAGTPVPESTPTDATESVQIPISALEDSIATLKDFACDDYQAKLLANFPELMDNDIVNLCEYFSNKVKEISPLLAPFLLPALSAPVPAVAAPLPHVIPWDAQPPTDKSNSYPCKKVHVKPSDVTPSATAPPAMQMDEPAGPPPASRKAPAKLLPIPSSKCAPEPKCTPPVSFSAPSASRKRHQGKHTAHGALHHGIILTPPAGSSVTAESFSPGVLNNLNQVLRSNVKSNVTLTHATVDGNGIFLAASRVPTAAEIQFVLKHVRRTFPNKSSPIVQTPATSTSYLKIVDIPHVPASPKEWASKQHEAFIFALDKSLVGALLAKLFKHKLRFMRASPHSDSCWAWVNIHDTVSGSNAQDYISKDICIRSMNCQIQGAKPHSGSVRCARCQQWGHHSDQCRAKCMRCPLCGGPHTEANHPKLIDASHVNLHHCVNCTAAKHPADKCSHSATDTKCPFWQNRFDRSWLNHQFPKN